MLTGKLQRKIRDCGKWCFCRLQDEQTCPCSLTERVLTIRSDFMEITTSTWCSVQTWWCPAKDWCRSPSSAVSRPQGLSLCGRGIQPYGFCFSEQACGSLNLAWVPLHPTPRPAGKVPQACVKSFLLLWESASVRRRGPETGHHSTGWRMITEHCTTTDTIC